MNKLLFFTSDYSIGIGALMVDELIALNKEGIDLIAIGGNKQQEPGLIDKINSNGINLILIDAFDVHNNFFQKVKCIKKIIVENHVNVIHVQNNWQLAIIAYIKIICRVKIKVIYTIHAFRHNQKLKSILAQIIIGTALFLFADKVICMCNYLKKKFNFLSYKIILLPLGISDEYFTESFIQPPQKGLRLVFPAQFRHGKNQDMIIRAFARYIKDTEDSDSTLMLPGNGILLEKMKDLVNDLKITDRVIFPGLCTKSQTKDLYLKSNIGLVSSNSETFGQSIVEPFVLGRCVISRPVGIAPDIIKQENGFIFHTEEDLYKIFISLKDDKKLITTMGMNNYNNRDSFRWENISKQYKKLLLG